MNRFGSLLAAGLLVAANCGPNLVGEPATPTPSPAAHTGRVGTTPPVDQAGGLIADRLPRVAYQGGPFLRSPRPVTITFDGDDPALVERLERFGAAITDTRWWFEVVDSYCATPRQCVGAGSAAPPVRLDQRLPRHLRDTDLEALLQGHAESRRFGALDLNSLLLVYLPAGITLADATGRYCGNGPRGLHRALRLPHQTLPYAVIPRCDIGSDAASELTATASHEILEATTNPDPARPGFAFERDANTHGFTAAGVEPVDPCGLITLDRHRTADSDFTLQRAWSNRAAASGRNPCVPARQDLPYVALIPAEPVIRLEPWSTIKIPVTAAADRPAGPWKVRALDVSEHRGRPRCVRASLHTSTIAAGQTTLLTLTSFGAGSEAPCVVLLVSTLGTDTNGWPLAVILQRG